MNVLIVGKSQKALDGAVALIEERGHRADATNEFDAVLTDFEPARYDVVVLGGKVPPELKVELAAAFRTANPDVRIVHGLAGIPGVIAAQVEEALAGETRQALAPPRFEAGSRRVVITLTEPESATVTVYWGTSFVPPDPTSTSLVLLDGELPAGEHAIGLPDLVPDRSVFATVCVGDLTYALAPTS